MTGDKRGSALSTTPKPNDDGLSDLSDSDNEKPKQHKKKTNKCQTKGEDFLDSWQWGVFMAVITVYTLFADDLRVLLLPPRYDDFFFFLTTVCLVLFTLEIIVSSYCKPKYIPFFFFWLDVFSTVSMVFDIGWITDGLSSVMGGSTDAASVGKTSRAARVTRIVRLVRLIRLVRIVKLYK